MKFIAKHKVLFYILQFTWGVLLNTIGAVVALVMLISGHKPHYFHNCVYFNVGREWGGLELGCFFLTDASDSDYVKRHESGHALQNIIWGPLFIFVIWIPSAIRYWHRERLVRSGKCDYNQLPDYDSIWFEGQATKWGTTMYE